MKEFNDRLRNILKINHWQNSDNTIEWFKNINSNKNLKFFQIDIVNFYPSISEELLDNTIRFAKNYITIPEDDIDLIKHCRKSFLFHENKIWKKSNCENNFDVTMGSFDGAELCEFVGIYITSLIQDNFPHLNFGLYRDDGLGFHNSMPGPQVSKLQKDIIKIFKSCKLDITSAFNLDQVDFLDLTLNITTKKYWPYRKPNNQPLYIHQESNHPPAIKKEIPKMINNRLSKISCNAEEFDKSKEIYQKALESSKFNHSLKYQNNEKDKSKMKKRSRKRKIIWFNPPFNENVQTRIGQQVLKLIDKHFPKGSKLHKIFNKNTIKISYSCMPNMKNIINSRNRKLLNNANKNNNDEEKTCNCRNKNECPMNNKCLTESIVYKATVSTDEGNDKKVYIGSCESTFKTRYSNHKKSFNNEKYKHETKLSSYIWQLKESKEEYKIEWDILEKSKPYLCGSRNCSLCITEKLHIMLNIKEHPNQVLNNRSEILSKCRHSNKFKLKNIK